MGRRAFATQPVAARSAAARNHRAALFACRINRALKVEVHDDVVILSPEKCLDQLRYHQIHLEGGRVGDLLRQSTSWNLLIDLRAGPRLDAVVIGLLVQFCRAVQGRSAFCNLSDDAWQALRAANLDRLWPMFSSRPEALEFLSAEDG